MKMSRFSSNLALIRGQWEMNRKQFGQLFGLTELQIGGYERGSSNIPTFIIFELEEMTGIPAKHLFYEPLTRASIPLKPLSPTENTKTSVKETPVSSESFGGMQTDILNLMERVKRLEMKVFR